MEKENNQLLVAQDLEVGTHIFISDLAALDNNSIEEKQHPGYNDNREMIGTKGIANGVMRTYNL